MAIDLNITEENENSLMKRRELTVEVSHPGEATPSRATLQGLVAKLADADPEYTEIREVRSGTGRAASRVRAHVWEDKEIGLYAGDEPEEDSDEQEAAEEETEDKEPGETPEDTEDEPDNEEEAEQAESSEEPADEEEDADEE